MENNGNTYSPLDVAKFNVENAMDALAEFRGDNLDKLSKASIALGQAYMALMLLSVPSEQEDVQETTTEKE